MCWLSPARRRPPLFCRLFLLAQENLRTAFLLSRYRSLDADTSADPQTRRFLRLVTGVSRDRSPSALNHLRARQTNAETRHALAIPGRRKLSVRVSRECAG